MKLKKLELLAVITLLALSQSIYSDDQIKGDDTLDVKTYIHWKRKDPQKLEQLKAYIQACIPFEINTKTLERDIKKALSFYKTKITLTIDDLVKKISKKNIPKKKSLPTKKRTSNKRNVERPAIEIPTEELTTNELKEKLHTIQRKIEQTLVTKYTALTIEKIGGKTRQTTETIRELDQDLKYLYLERTSILELSKQNGQKSLREVTTFTQEFDAIIAKAKKCYLEDLEEL